MRGCGVLDSALDTEIKLLLARAGELGSPKPRDCHEVGKQMIPRSPSIIKTYSSIADCFQKRPTSGRWPKADTKYLDLARILVHIRLSSIHSYMLHKENVHQSSTRSFVSIKVYLKTRQIFLVWLYAHDTTISLGSDGFAIRRGCSCPSEWSLHRAAKGDQQAASGLPAHAQIQPFFSRKAAKSRRGEASGNEYEASDMEAAQDQQASDDARQLVLDEVDYYTQLCLTHTTCVTCTRRKSCVSSPYACSKLWEATST